MKIRYALEVLAALAVGTMTMSVDLSTADAAPACRTNYYRCSLNRGGRIDPDNPNCCWSPLAGPPNTCPRNYYKCDLNRGGRIDPEHPGCCWNLR